ncbi:hypothetical protein Lesp02_15890 [Lentzea sp. NBRC 105346]|nr:hypothetical protein Lesp02_15890 [Lentzea sp. NBRC 105346]
MFVVRSSTSGYGTFLHGLNASTGTDAWPPVDLGGTYWWAALAYGGGTLFAQNSDGVLTAFNPATGQQVWRVQLPGQWSFTSPPTYRAGVVYTAGAGSGGTVYAVRATDGAVLWTASVANGDNSSPAVTDSGVYVSYACEQAYAFKPDSGGLIWHHSTGCSGGGGRTPVYADSAVWIRDSGGKALNASDGTERGTFPHAFWDPAPAFDGRQGYFLEQGTLTERHSRTLAARWTFAGDGQLSSAPLVINGQVYVGSRTGKVYALNGATGAQVWSADAGAPINGPDEHNVSQPLTGFGAGGGLLVVPASTRLVAYGQP